MNSLATETSPYLLQHRNNPVNWFAWNSLAWQKAKDENALVLISIGYSACHWCHVMEKEVFEDFECAEMMNHHLVCIKVDREERPDVDSVYMDAIHLMGSQGGWPLNVFVLPDGRPVYGGTYFPKQQWLNILDNLTDLWKNDRNRVFEYADKLSQGMTAASLIGNNDTSLQLDREFLENKVSKWVVNFDLKNGGSRGAPKFPMPNNFEFLLHYGYLAKAEHLTQHVHLSLEKMARGGIFDQAGGGFCRYSVDDTWKVPHFEKMLYDNAQLVSLLAQTYLQSRNELFLESAERTIEFLKREMKSESGLYYAAIDADSEGVEGKFYVWTSQELKAVLNEDYEFASNYYSIDQEGEWEHGQNILLRTKSDEEFADDFQLELSDVRLRRDRVNKKILEARSNRIRPGVDDKCITSWNAMLVNALVLCYRANGDEEYLNEAQHLMQCIRKLLISESGHLHHCYTKGKSTITAFHDDYAFLMDAAIRLFEVTHDSAHLYFAKELMDTCNGFFLNEENGLYFFTSATKNDLLLRKMEVQDNVMPSSNSVMAKVLFELARHLDKPELEEQAKRMLQNISPQISHASAFSNWLQLYTRFLFPYNEIVVTGPDSGRVMHSIQTGFYPNCLFAASTNESELPLFQHRIGTQSAIYVCSGKSCFPPTENIQQAISYLH